MKFVKYAGGGVGYGAYEINGGEIVTATEAAWPSGDASTGEEYYQAEATGALGTYEVRWNTCPDYIQACKAEDYSRVDEESACDWNNPSAIFLKETVEVTRWLQKARAK